jgi:hypothetical protein
MSAKDGLNDNEIQGGSQEDSPSILTDSYKTLILLEVQTSTAQHKFAPGLEVVAQYFKQLGGNLHNQARNYAQLH